MKNIFNNYKALKAKSVEASKLYHETKTQTEKAVVRWGYYLDRLWEPELTWDGRNLESKVKSEPQMTDDPEKAKFAYGFDAEGRVLCAREYEVRNEYKWPPGVSDISQRETIYHREIRIEYFVFRQQDIAEIFYYLSNYSHTEKQTIPKLAVIWRLRLDNGKVLETEKYSPRDDTYHHEVYSWNGEQLKLVRYADKTGRVTEENEYDDSGNSQWHYLRRDGSRIVEGEQSMPAGMTLKKLLENVRKDLLQAIPRAVKAAKIKEPIYCIALAYDGEGNDILPPLLGIGLESERVDWIKAKGCEAKNFIWNPAEFKNYETSEIELGKDAEWLNEKLSDNDSLAPAKRLLVEVAADLQKLDWEKIAKVTPDFVIYPVDFELGDLRKNLKKVLSEDKFASLKAAKLI